MSHKPAHPNVLTVRANDSNIVHRAVNLSVPAAGGYLHVVPTLCNFSLKTAVHSPDGEANTKVCDVCERRHSSLITDWRASVAMWAFDRFVATCAYIGLISDHVALLEHRRDLARLFTRTLCPVFDPSDLKAAFKFVVTFMATRLHCSSTQITCLIAAFSGIRPKVIYADLSNIGGSHIYWDSGESANVVDNAPYVSGILSHCNRQIRLSGRKEQIVSTDTIRMQSLTCHDCLGAYNFYTAVREAIISVGIAKELGYV